MKRHWKKHIIFRPTNREAKLFEVVVSGRAGFIHRALAHYLDHCEHAAEVVSSDGASESERHVAEDFIRNEPIARLFIERYSNGRDTD